MTEEKRQFDTGRKKISFNDPDGVEFASFYLNPTDAGMIARAEETAEFFSHRASEVGVTDASALAEYSREIEEKICYLLGYDASATLFSNVTATTVSPSGEIFANAVLEAIADEIGPELEKRGRAMKARAAEYTAKYEGGK